MGADGGTIPKRCELVRNKKKKEKVDKNVAAAAKYRACQATQEPLKKPIVACKLGQLFNKEAILEAKLNKTLSLNETTKHIKNLGDVKELRLTENKSYKGDGPENADSFTDFNETPYICPVTSLGMNGQNVFLINWNCGCVISEKAIKEVPCDTCHGCGGKFDSTQLIQLYPPEDILEQYKERIAKERSLKKSSKAVEGTSTGTSSSSATGKSSCAEEKAESGKPLKKSEKVEVGKKRKAEESSIQENPKLSAAYKSLFTTSEEAKNKPQAHWVTHNPLYY